MMVESLVSVGDLVSDGGNRGVQQDGRETEE